MAVARCSLLLFSALFAARPLLAQAPVTVRCAHLLAADGEGFRDDVVVELRDGEVLAVRAPRPDERTTYELDGWVVPGMIDLHTHLLLHPYDEASWEDQVLRESLELRSIRATAAALATLRAGFVAVRELGTEGAGFADVALRDAIRGGIVPGPVVVATTRAIAAVGCYGPRLAAMPDDTALPKGAQLVSGKDQVRAAVRQQVQAGADWIKVHADYRRAPGQAATPTFSQPELDALCDEARAAGVPVAAHATTDEGARRAVLAGVRTIEHGTALGEDTLQLMVERGVVLCPCLAANEAIVGYAGRTGPVARRLDAARVAFQRALALGVTIACGSDAGVFDHGDNGRELELMVAYGMTPQQALAAATTGAAAVLGRPELGVVRPGARPGLVALAGDPLAEIGSVRRVTAVLHGDRPVAR